MSLLRHSTMVVPLCGPSSTVTTPRDEVDDDDEEDSTEAIEAGPKLLALHEAHAADGTWIFTRFSSHCETRCAGSEENGASIRPGDFGVRKQWALQRV